MLMAFPISASRLTIMPESGINVWLFERHYTIDRGLMGKVPEVPAAPDGRQGPSLHPYGE
jgi:hypothetical protein